MSNIKSFAIYKKKGRKPVTYETKKLKIMKSFTKETFIFKAPKNTNITKI